MLCLDTTIFILTLVKTIKMRHHLQYGLVRVLFRDGEYPGAFVKLLKSLTAHYTGAVYYGCARVWISASHFSSDAAHSILVVAGVANILTFVVRFTQPLNNLPSLLIPADVGSACMSSVSLYLCLY